MRWLKTNVPAIVARIVAPARPNTGPPMRRPSRNVAPNHSSVNTALGKRAPNSFTSENPHRSCQKPINERRFLEPGNAVVGRDVPVAALQPSRVAGR